jgi:hypothetical protein
LLTVLWYRASRQNSCFDFAEELLAEAKDYILSGSDIVPKDLVEGECERIKENIRNPPKAPSLRVNSADYFNDAHR